MLYPEVKLALEWLGNEAVSATVSGGGAQMSGTGSSVFARFSSREQAAAVLARKPAGLAGFIARGTNVSPLHKLLF